MRPRDPFLLLAASSFTPAAATDPFPHLARNIPGGSAPRADGGWPPESLPDAAKTTGFAARGLSASVPFTMIAPTQAKPDMT